MKKPTFKAFLSHRYQAPEENLHFFDVVSTRGNLRFEVDVGVKATNVTRIERFIRDADAFVGIYPFPSTEDGHSISERALQASRYFRLELDIAHRSRRPTLVFMDERYGTAITVPSGSRLFRYERGEVGGVGSDRRDSQLARLVREYCAEVAATMRLGDDRAGIGRDRVGIILPREGKAAYSAQDVAMIEGHLSKFPVRTIHLDWKSALDGPFMRELESLDWAIVDMGAEACASGLPAFLHGYFVPQMRLVRISPEQTRSPLEATLLAAFEVGYPKDIIRWSDSETLEREFVQRLTTLYEPRSYIGDSDAAREYFIGASRRKEAVFLSYSGEDRGFAEGVATALRKRFQQVFDYRDAGESIVPGRRWLEEIFDKLSSSAIGIPLLSSAYFSSGNCLHEAREMMARADARQLSLIPVKISKGPLETPTWMQDLQYLRGWEYPTPEELADKIVSAYGATGSRGAVVT